MQQYNHYADYLIKRAISDINSIDQFLRYALFSDWLWERKVVGEVKNIKYLKSDRDAWI